MDAGHRGRTWTLWPDSKSAAASSGSDRAFTVYGVARTAWIEIGINESTGRSGSNRWCTKTIWKLVLSEFGIHRQYMSHNRTGPNQFSVVGPVYDRPLFANYATCWAVADRPYS